MGYLAKMQVKNYQYKCLLNFRKRRRVLKNLSSTGFVAFGEPIYSWDGAGEAFNMIKKMHGFCFNTHHKQEFTDFKA